MLTIVKMKTFLFHLCLEVVKSTSLLSVIESDTVKSVRVTYKEILTSFYADVMMIIQ